MMQRKVYCLLFSLLFFARANAIEAILSHSVFYLADPIYAGNLNPYIEAYWQVNPKTVHFATNSEKKIVARLQVDVLITNDTGKILKEDNYIYQTRPCSTPDELEMLNILELKRYLTTSGSMKMVLKLTDLNESSNYFTVTDTLTIPKLSPMPFYGSIELIDTFYESDVRSPFRKHGRQYIPLCGNFFDTYKKNISYYSEAYQLANIAKSDFPLTHTAFISKKENDASGSLKNIDTITNENNNFYSGSIDISKLPSGNYYFNVQLKNKDNKELASRSIFFQRLNNYKNKEEIKAQQVAMDTGLEHVNVVDLGKTFLAKYNLPQIKAMLKMILPISNALGTSTIENFLKKPDDLYMRYYLYNHFNAIDSKSPENAWKKYSEKIAEVNKLFTNHGTLGYETERGYMYLRYGPPSEVVTAAHEKGALPYEIWQYNLLKDYQGRNMSNSVILFYKQYETDFDYKVLHTNISGELHNPGWRSYLYNTNDNNADNSMSRAEQYIGNR